VRTRSRHSVPSGPSPCLDLDNNAEIIVDGVDLVGDALSPEFAEQDRSPDLLVPVLP
jgi:hypothetical protein